MASSATAKVLDLDKLDGIERSRETVECAWKGLLFLNCFATLFFVSAAIYLHYANPQLLTQILATPIFAPPMSYVTMTVVSLPIYVLLLLSIVWLNPAMMLLASVVFSGVVALAAAGLIIKPLQEWPEFANRPDILALSHSETITQLFYTTILLIVFIPQVQATIAAFRNRDVALLKPARTSHNATMLRYFGWPAHLPAVNLRRALPFTLFFIATLVYVLTFILGMNNIGLASGQNDSAIHAARLNPNFHVNFQANAVYVVVLTNTILSIILMLGGVWLSRLIENFAKSRVRFSMSEALSTDQRAPVLFLRTFADDQVGLKPAKRRLFTRFLEIGSGKKRLDHVVLEEGFAYGPVVALGRPGEPFPPYGVARGYFENADWQQAVRKLCADSAAIVLTMDEGAGAGTWWEFDQLTGGDALGKTLFLIHPSQHAPVANQRLLDKMIERVPTTGEGAAAARRMLLQCRHTAAQTPVLGFYFDGTDGRVVIGTGERFEHRSYRVMTRAFLRDITTPDLKAG